MSFKAIRKAKNLPLWGQFDYLALALLPITCWKLATPERDKAHWAAEVECSNYISNSPPKCCSLVRSSSMLQTLHMSLSTLNWLSPTSLHVKHKAIVTSSNSSRCAQLVPMLRQTFTLNVWKKKLLCSDGISLSLLFNLCYNFSL